MKFLSGYNLKIFIFWWEDEGGGEMSKFWASGGTLLQPPSPLLHCPSSENRESGE